MTSLTKLRLLFIAQVLWLPARLRIRLSRLNIYRKLWWFPRCGQDIITCTQPGEGGLGFAVGAAEVHTLNALTGILSELYPLRCIPVCTTPKPPVGYRQHDLILLGGPITNTVTREVMEKSTALNYRFVGHDLQHRRNPEVVFSGYPPDAPPNEPFVDYALIAKVDSPFRPDRQVLIVAGCRTFGSRAAGLLVTAPEYVEMITDRVGADPFEVVIKAYFRDVFNAPHRIDILHNDFFPDDITILRPFDRYPRDYLLNAALFVDDEPALYPIVQEALKGTLRLVTARNGKEALAVIKRQRPLIVFTDISMPDMDGEELLRRQTVKKLLEGATTGSTEPGRRPPVPSASTQEDGMETPRTNHVVAPEQSPVAVPDEAQRPIEEIRQAVIDSLEHPMYCWRTVPAMAAELGLEIGAVEGILRELSTAKPRILVRSSRRSTTGEALYTTVRHYKERIPVGRRLAAAFQNRTA